MKLKHAGFREGVLWVRSGFRIFFRFPLAFTGLFMMFMFGGFMLWVLPYIGALLLLTALPIVTLGFMLATERALQGRTPLPDVFIEPLRTDRARRMQFFKLGALYAVAVVLATLVIQVIDGDRLERWQAAVWREAQRSAGGEAAEPPQPQAESASSADEARPAPPAAAASAARSADRELIEDSSLQWSLLLRVLVFTPVSLLFWHAPALVHWGGVPVRKSLFFSIVACWRNLGAFTGYGLAWGAVVLIFSVATTFLFTLFGQPQLVPLAVMPAALMFSTVFYASLYFTFVGSFGPSPDPLQDTDDHDTTTPA